MGLLSEIRQLRGSEPLCYGVIPAGLIAPGLLYLFHFHLDFVTQGGTVVVLAVSVALSIPFVMANSFLAALDDTAGKNGGADRKGILDIVAQGSLASIIIAYMMLAFAYFKGHEPGQFITAAIVGETGLVIWGVIELVIANVRKNSAKAKCDQKLVADKMSSAYVTVVDSLKPTDAVPSKAIMDGIPNSPEAL